MEEKKFFCRWDIILIICLLALGILPCCIMGLTRTGGRTVTVELDGKIYASLPLDNDTVLTIDPDGDGRDVNVLVIKSGTAFVTDADCPGRHCALHAPISAVGESIICLPHRLVVRISE